MAGYLTKFLCIFLALVVLLITFHLSLITCQDQEEEEDSEQSISISKRLQKALLKDYNNTLPPLLFRHERRIFSAGNQLISIHDLDEATATLTSESIFYAAWSDHRLMWNRTEFNKTRLRLPSNLIWTPTFHILNKARMEQWKLTKIPTLVYSVGIVVTAIPMLVHSTCEPNLRYFPFDKYECIVQFGSWTLEGDLINANISAPDLKRYSRIHTGHYSSNTRWKLRKALVKISNDTSESKQKMLVDNFVYFLERTTPLAALGILTPAVLCMLLSLATFWLEPENTLRTALGSTTVLVATITLLGLNNLIPINGKNTPIIVEYCATCLMVSVLAMIHTILASILSRCRLACPFVYSKILDHIPGWLLKFFVINLASPSYSSIDETQLVEATEATVEETAVDASDTQTIDRQVVVNKTNDWQGCIMLVDRASFYIYLVLWSLFIISVLATEHM